MPFERSSSDLEKKFGAVGAIVDASDSCIVITDPKQEDNPVVYVNRGFTELTGYSYDECVGRNCRFLQGNDRDQPGIATLRNAVREGKGVCVVLRNYRKNGQPFYNELYVSAVYDERGQLIYFMGVQNDVSERINRKQQLQKTIEQTLRNASWLSQSVVDNLSKIRSAQAEADLRLKEARPKVAEDLTEREFQVLHLLVEGCSNKEIAKRLDLALSTARNYV